MRSRLWICPATTVDQDTKMAKGRSWMPAWSASAPCTPWKNWGSRTLQGMKAAAWSVDAMV
jgi:hypothetical protein